MKMLSFAKLKTLFISYFDISSYLLPQSEAETAIREGVSFKGTNIIILILAILIASLGLNTNSTAVIIGAMLISPLMGPIIGLGLGVGILDFELIKRSIRNLAMAALFSVIASTIYFMISPVNEGHSELLARTSPTIYDVLIGFVGGGAGILAIGSRSKGNVIPGVAIATALMPPLCTAGYGLATLQMHYFLGAFYLFVINSIYIAFATTIGVKLMKYTPKSFVDVKRAKKVKQTVYWCAILTMLPSIYLTYAMIRDNNFSMRASRFVTAEFNFPATQVLNYKAQTLNGERVIDVTLIGRMLPTDSLQLAMTSQLSRFGLEGTRLNIIQGDSYADFDISSMSSSMLKDIYQITQSTINRQKATIDSLISINIKQQKQDSISAVISPEIKVLFPEIKDIAITKTIFSNIARQVLDTVNVALVKYSSPLNYTQQQKFKEYLQARLKIGQVDIVDIDPFITLKNS